ncbi:hypothetical protein C0995_006835 [Termitomyces sp. Mi166|nr:hypothetical protein C0995_006835 [Termitomyces sp. Mi166\
MSVLKSVPVKSAGKPAIKRGSVIKDPFIVRQFKLAGTEESGALIINQVTEVAAGKVASAVTQETLQSEEDTGNKNNNDKGSNNNEENKNDKGGKDNEDDNDDNGNDDNDAAMDIDSGSLDAKILKTLCPEKTQQKASTKATVTDNVVLVPDYKSLFNFSKIVPVLNNGKTVHVASMKRQLECWRRLEGVSSQYARDCSGLHINTMP